VNGKHLIRFQNETSVFKSLQSNVDRALDYGEQHRRNT